MNSTSETGHAKNLATFKTIVNFFCQGYGAAYNPATEQIKLEISSSNSKQPNKPTPTVSKNKSPSTTPPTCA